MAVKLEPAKHNGAPSRHSCKASPLLSWYHAGNWVLGSTGPAAFSEAEAEFASTKRPRRAAKNAVATSRKTEPVGDVRCASEAAAPLGAPPRLLALPANCIVVLPPRDECVRGRTRARRRGGARKGASRQTVGPRTADPACPTCPGAPGQSSAVPLARPPAVGLREPGEDEPTSVRPVGERPPPHPHPVFTQPSQRVRARTSRAAGWGVFTPNSGPSAPRVLGSHGS